MSAQGQMSVSMELVKTSPALEQNASPAPREPVFTSLACLVMFVKYLSDARQADLAHNTWSANTMRLYRVKHVRHIHVKMILSAFQVIVSQLATKKKRFASHKLISGHHARMTAQRRTHVIWAIASHQIVQKKNQPIATRVAGGMIQKLSVL